MQTTPSASRVPSISVSDLLAFDAAGGLEIEVKQVGFFFVPMAYFCTPGARKPLGIVVNDGQVLASFDLDAMLGALRESLGISTVIRVPDRVNSPIGTTH
jgi:hypothetical protein